MITEGVVLAKFANEITDNLINTVIHELQTMHETLSGDDSCLENVWEEICVQCQLEKSFSWDAYEQTIETLITVHVEKLKDHERIAVWFQNEEGIDWLNDSECDEEEIPIGDVNSDVSFYLFGKIINKATDFSNSRIEEYIDSRFEDDSPCY